MMKTTLIPAAPTRTVNLKTLLIPMLSPATSLVPLRKSGEARLARGKQTSGLSALLPLEANTVAIPRVRGIRGTIQGLPESGPIKVKVLGATDLDVPTGLGRHISPRALKVLLKANKRDVLFRKTGERWEVVPDAARIDLLDDSIQYRIGRLQVYS